MQTNSYPWANLFTEDVIGSDMPVDPHELANQVKTRELEIAQLAEEVAKQKQLVESQDEHVLEQKAKLLLMKEVSTKTFDSLEARILELESELDSNLLKLSKALEDNKQLQESVQEKGNALQEQLASRDPNSELIYQILIYNIMYHKAGLSSEATREKTLHSAVRWLKQRRNVVDYLRRHKLHTETADNLENILFIDEKTLNTMLNTLAI
jgi:hypothetical protein